MSHVDEGRLSEYLDRLERQGETPAAWAPELRAIEEHLAGCAECHARLEDVRQVRERASAILSGSGPTDAAAPPFDEILARKRALSRRRIVFRMNRLTAVGWAATIVFAVGIGWIARGSLEWRESGRVDEPIPVATPIAARAPAARDSAAAVEQAADRSGARTEVERDQAPPPEPSADAPAPAVSDVVAGAGVAQQAGGPPADVAPAVEKDVAPPPPSVAAAAVVQLERQDTALEARAYDAEQRLRRYREEAAPSEAVRGIAAFDSVSRLQQAQAVEWAPATAAETESALGRAPLVVPELPIVSLKVGTLGNRPAVQVRQALPSGATLTLVEWRDAGEPALPEPRRPSMIAAAADTALQASADNAVMVRRDGYLLLVWAGLSRDSLLALVERVR